MPSKVRYCLYTDRWYKGKAAYKCLSELTAQAAATKQSWTCLLKAGFSREALQHNFTVMQKAGFLGKGMKLRVYREREHVRLAKSPYRQALPIHGSRRVVKGRYVFQGPYWQPYTRVWAVPLLEALDFHILFQDEISPTGSWRIATYAFPWSIHSRVEIIDGVVKKASLKGATNKVEQAATQPSVPSIHD